MDFPTTNWTLLAKATLHGSETAMDALNRFVLNYRAPIVALLRRRGVIESRLDDLAQDFMLQLMVHSALKRADRDQGRFRNYIRGAMRRFLADDVVRRKALKRGGGMAPLSLDAGDNLAEHLAKDDDEMALMLDREWALHLIQRALSRVMEGVAGLRAERLAVLRQFLPGATESISQQEAAGRLGLSDAAFRTELSRIRGAFREAVRQEVAATVTSPEDTDDELRHLLEILQSCPPQFFQTPSAATS